MRNNRIPLVLPLSLLLCSGFHAALAQDFETQVIVRGLERPTGIAVQGSSRLFITQLPTPGVSGRMGGRNTVDQIDLDTGIITNLTTGEPEPTNLALDKHSTLYWTCKSAGVILTRNPRGNVSLFLGDQAKPSGIAIDRWDNVYFTLVPTPALPGSMGGENSVNVTDGREIVELSSGEPEPVDIAVSPSGDAYWTCKSAGVILTRPANGTVRLLLRELQSPTGIALDHTARTLYWTEVPTPGVPGRLGGRNKVSELDLGTMQVKIVDAGDPEPTDIAVARNGNLFWTCSSAGVIVQATRVAGR